MANQIFINLAVQDPEKSMAFYTAMGFKNNPQFSDESGKCMVWSDNIIQKNNFIKNTFDVSTNGTLLLNIFSQNYWDKS